MTTTVVREASTRVGSGRAGSMMVSLDAGIGLGEPLCRWTPDNGIRCVGAKPSLWSCSDV
jgi:hypothetical protein